jgi:hypothetical protein
MWRQIKGFAPARTSKTGIAPLSEVSVWDGPGTVGQAARLYLLRQFTTIDPNRSRPHWRRSRFPPRQIFDSMLRRGVKSDRQGMFAPFDSPLRYSPAAFDRSICPRSRRLGQHGAAVDLSAGINKSGGSGSDQ